MSVFDERRTVAGISHTWSPATRGGRSQGRADPERFLAGRIDHLGLPCDYRTQNFLLFLLGHIEVVQRTADLRSNLVELFRSEWRSLWASPSSLPV